MKLSTVIRAMTPEARRRAEAKLRSMTPHERDVIRRRLHEMKGQDKPNA